MRTPTPVFWPLVLILLVSACSDRQNTQPVAAGSASFPGSFDSVDAAKARLNRYPTGGRIDKLRLGWRSHFVVFRHGSGLPVVGIGVYRRNLFSWKLISEHRPPHPPVGILRAEVRDGKIVLISIPPSDRIWPLSQPE